MTIQKYIANFIKQYDTIKIDTNHVQDGSDKYGLYKSPSRDFVRAVNGDAIITEYYQFFAAQKSVSETERMEDDEWLEDFVYWVDDYPLKYNYPEITGNRMITDIQVTGNPTPFRDDDNGIMYQVSLKITYEREA